MQEAVRSGNLKSVELLLSSGADVNARTILKSGEVGGSILYWALEYYDDDHDIVKLLKTSDAKNIRPGAPKHDEL
jgi:ankyrin repeat protein